MSAWEVVRLSSGLKRDLRASLEPHSRGPGAGRQPEEGTGERDR